MKKNILTIVFIISCVTCSSIFSIGCNKKQVETNNVNQIYSVYTTYVAYAESNKETPLSYEDWLASIKGEKGDKGETGLQGEKGDKGDKGDAGRNGVDGVTPSIEIIDGYWYINGEKTCVKAEGKDGKNGTNGQDGVTPSVEISDDGYWVINGEKTESKVNSMSGKSTLADKKVLIIGDSISTDSNSTGSNYGDYEKWVMKLIKQGFFSADKVTNDSISGTGFSVTSGDITSGAAPEPENLFINRLKAVENPEQYELVIIFGGINDFIRCQSVDIEFSTFTTAVDEFFAYLTDAFINARICVFTPLRIYYNSTNLSGHIQQDYMEYIKDVAKSYCLPTLNLSEESGFYAWKKILKIVGLSLVGQVAMESLEMAFILMKNGKKNFLYR